VLPEASSHESWPALDPADLAVCTELLAAGSKSFSLASKVLPARVRPNATVLYAFCRLADDAVDDAPKDRVADAVRTLTEELDEVYNAPIHVQRSATHRALSVVVREQRIPRTLLDALIEGMVWDAENRRYETLDDLCGYGARVAGTVGAMMTLLMGRRSAEVLARACDLGVAMQLTNIARDVGEDAARGRLYLPLSWMRAEGVDPEAFLRAPQYSAELAKIVQKLLAAADDLYTRASPGVALLPADCRTAIRAAALIYREIGRVVTRANYDSVTRRAVVSKARKLWLLARSFFARFERYRALPAPPLPSTLYLVQAAESEQP
jgi:15-cis-phytoene synthase